MPYQPDDQGEEPDGGKTIATRAAIPGFTVDTFDSTAQKAFRISLAKQVGVEPAQVRSAPVLAKPRDRVENLLDAYHFFTFGTPSVTQLSDGTIVVAFYVTEEHVTYVRCCRLKEKDS